ncbi:MAG TPA: metal ABC transporter permease [Candidatus Binatia bacterium]|nr:metal ABC transporter permease [Candidatus Binatia bacterium]
MGDLLQILSPSFLLRDALIASVLVGVVCPLVGVYFVLRRMIFLGVALPQVSAAGIAAAFFAYQFIVGPHQQMVGNEHLLAMVGSFAFTMSATLMLALLERRGRETVEARIGTTYAVAAAATILFLAKDPHGDAQMVNLLKGDILATTSASLAWMVVSFTVIGFALLAFRKELLLVSFDRDLAIVFGKRAGLWDVVLYLMIGGVISLGVMTAGPMATFGFLVVPPVTMRMITGRMMTFMLGSAALGGATAFTGFYCAYRFDLPLGPSEVALSSGVLLVAWLAATARRAIRSRRSP